MIIMQSPLHQLVSSEQVLLEEAARDHLEEVAELSSAERTLESAVVAIGTEREALASRAPQLEASMAVLSVESGGSCAYRRSPPEARLATRGRRVRCAARTALTRAAGKPLAASLAG